MADFKLLNYAGKNGEARAGILAGNDTVVDLLEALPVQGSIGTGGYGKPLARPRIENAGYSPVRRNRTHRSVAELWRRVSEAQVGEVSAILVAVATIGVGVIRIRWTLSELRESAGRVVTEAAADRVVGIKADPVR